MVVRGSRAVSVSERCEKAVAMGVNPSGILGSLRGSVIKIGIDFHFQRELLVIHIGLSFCYILRWIFRPHHYHINQCPIGLPPST